MSSEFGKCKVCTYGVVLTLLCEKYTKELHLKKGQHKPDIELHYLLETLRDSGCSNILVSKFLIYFSFQNSTMPRLKDGLSFKPLLSSYSAVVFHHTVVFLLLTQCCAGNLHTNTTNVSKE